MPTRPWPSGWPEDYLPRGTTPPLHPDGLTVRDLANRFLSAKKAAVDRRRTLAPDLGRLLHDLRGDGRSARQDAARSPTSRATDFEKFRAKLAKTRGPVALGNEIQRVRTVLKFA